jgi:hypothetical protein
VTHKRTEAWANHSIPCVCAVGTGLSGGKDVLRIEFHAIEGLRMVRSSDLSQVFFPDLL